MPTTFQAELPDALWRQAQSFVEQGWADNMQDLVTESLRRYLDSHQEALAEQLVRDDVDWGLHGND